MISKKNLDWWYDDGQTKKVGTKVNYMKPNWLERYKRRLHENRVKMEILETDD